MATCSRSWRAWALLLVCVSAWSSIVGGQLVASPPVTLTSTDSYDSGSDNKLLCMAEMVSSIENSCSNSDIQGLYVALEALLKQYLEKCFHTNFTQNRALHEIMPDLNENVTDWLKAQADVFKGLVNLEDIVPTFVPPQQVNAEVELMMQSNLANSYDGWLLDPYVYGLVNKYNGFYPLDDFVNDPILGIQWSDVTEFVRTMHATFKNQIVGFPVDVRMDLLFYRKDLLARVNATGPPQTWTELLRMARALNGTDLNGDGRADYGICMDVRADCGYQVNNLMAIAASMLQYSGTAQGVFFDPPSISTGSPSAILVNNPAFQSALQMYINLTKLAPPFLPTDTCTDPSLITNLFASGRCAFIVGSRIFKNTMPIASPVVRGNLGVSLLPGSSVVLDRATNTTVPCTSTLCPFAVPDADGNLINRTPWSGGGGWVLAVNRRSTSNYMNVTVAFHAYISQPNKTQEWIVNPTFEFEPFRYSHLRNLSLWTSAGYNPSDTQEWLNALQTSMDMSYTLDMAGNMVPGLGNNIAMDLRVPVTKYVRNMYVFAISNATLGVPINNVTNTLAASVAKILQDSQNVQASLAEIVDSYYATIRYQLPAPPPLPPAPPGSGADVTKGGSPSWLPIAIILPVIGALLLVATGVMYEVRNKRKHKDLFGKVLAPKLAPDTSILYMEIQGLEALTAALSPEVLAQAFTEYMNVVRGVLNKHSGYESDYNATTGAFTIAFHSPKDALLAGLDVQAALLNVNWAPEVVALEQCAPVYVLALSGDANESALKDILDANDSQLYASRPPARGRFSWFTNGLRKRKETAAAAANDSDANDLRLMGLGSAPAGPTIPALVHVPTSQTYSFAAACQSAWKDVPPSETNKVLIFKGLRVRMGIHAGVTNPEFIVETKDENKEKKRTQYVGTPVQLASAIANTAHGGMLLLSEDTYKKLPLERIWDRYLVIHVGEHNGLEGCAGSTNLYHALNRSLEGRLAHLSQMNSITQMDTGVLDAPVGCVTVAFMHVVGAQTLLSWNADIAQAALKLFHSVVGEELKARHGYLVEAVDGLFLAAFLKPLNAVMWALECNDLMLKQKWSDELLMHELCEELVISSPTREGDVLNTVVFRGPRLKTGVDTGQVLGEVHAMTGRMTYRGKVMNRAARIASTASTGQVLCSADSWELMQSRDMAALTASKITSSSLGQFRLKGVAERIEIFHCRKAQIGTRAQRRGNSMVINIHDKNRWNWELTQMTESPSRGEAVATNGINVDLAMPASLDKEHANGDLPHDGDIDDEHTRHHLAAETEDDMGVDDEDDDDTDADDDDDDMTADPYVLTSPPNAENDYSIAATRNSRQ